MPLHEDSGENDCLRDVYAVSFLGVCIQYDFDFALCARYED